MTDTPTLLKNSMSVCDGAAVMAAIDSLLEAGTPPEDIVALCNEGMGILGERFNDGDAFIPDLMVAGMIMKQAMTRLTPLLSDDAPARAGKTLVIGTVQHDIHDIGKDITAMIFRGNGFHVVDLGVNVTPEKFVDAIREHKPDFVGMSLLLTTCYKSVTDTIAAIVDAGLRDTIKICIGGAAASPLVAERCGIDFYAKTAVDGLTWAKQNV